jgi:hypothetical protein
LKRASQLGRARFVAPQHLRELLPLEAVSQSAGRVRAQAAEKAEMLKSEGLKGPKRAESPLQAGVLISIKQVAQACCVGAALYLGECCELYLADALSGYVEALANLFERLGLASGEAEAVLEDHPLALGEAV